MQRRGNKRVENGWSTPRSLIADVIRPQRIPQMKTIHSQVLASTGTDSHGDSIPREALERMFHQLADPWLINDAHDPSKPPIARRYNKQFLQLDNGNWAICADIDLFDDSTLEAYGGFSISFSRERYTMNPNRTPEITIGYNPRLFDKDDIIEVCHASTDDLQIDAKDVHQKGIDQPIILFLTFAAGAVFSDFFREIGKDGYALLKRKIASLSDKAKTENGQEVKCHMEFSIQRDGRTTEVLVSVSAADLDFLESQGFDAQCVIDQINNAVGDVDARKVVLKATRGGPLVTVTYFIDRGETVHTPNA